MLLTDLNDGLTGTNGVSDLPVAEIAVFSKHPISGADMKFFMYFVVNKNYSAAILPDFFAQNKAQFGPGAHAIEEMQIFPNREAADAHVREVAINNHNGLDIYWWPPNVIGDPAN